MTMKTIATDKAKPALGKYINMIQRYMWSELIYLKLDTMI
jgi:hypothetical protein